MIIQFRKWVYQNPLLFFILCIGIILRVYGLLTLPLSHDELSALHRARFSTFHELISKGVVVDNHPALIQVFIYFFVKLFGSETIWIRLPFMIIGTLTIYVGYVLGKILFHKNAGLILAICLATLQFPLSYSLYARPYVTGLFFTMLSLIFLWKAIHHKNNSKGYWMLWVLSAILACYNHYFSLLTVFLQAITLFPLAYHHKKLKPFLLFGAFIIVAFIPHIEILTKQLQHKGLEWLGAPRNDFLWQHIKYIFHHSWFYTLLLASFLVLSFLPRNSMSQNGNKIAIISVLGAVPFLLAFIYSKMYAPILQHAILLFSFPYHILIIATFFPKKSSVYVHVWLVLFCVVNVFTLIWKRDHFLISQKTPFKTLADDAYAISQEEALSVFHDLNPYYVGYYYDTLPPSNFTTVFGKKLSPSDWRKTLDTTQSKNILLANMPLNFWKIAEEKFPHLYYLNHTNNSTHIGLSKLKKEHNIIIRSKNVLQLNVRKILKEEYGVNQHFLLDSIINNRHQLIQVELNYEMDPAHNAVLVAEILGNKNEPIFWRGVDLNHFFTSNKQMQKAYLFIQINQLFKNHNEWKNHTLKLYLWNRKQKPLNIHSIEVKRLDWNPIEYGLFESIN